MNRSGHPDGLASACTSVAAVVLLASAACLLVIRSSDLSYLFFRDQDAIVLGIGAAFLLLLPRLAAGLVRRPASPSRLPVWAIALAVLLVAWAGTWLLFGNYALSRDEQLADFDASILAHGRLVAPIAPAWRPFAPALSPQFMLPIPPERGWLSGYLPGNAALRALGALTIGAAWVNPLLAALSVIALHRCAQRLWPGSGGLALLPVLLLASAPQFLAMAMTHYAMPAHLAFNLLWLACFLRKDRRGDVGAIAAGFAATGLHQIVFHPLFAGPFILHCWFRGERGRALFYVAAYAAIGLFWVSYWQLFVGHVGGNGPASASGFAYLGDKLRTMLGNASFSAPALMQLNLLRFVSWQNLLLVPLVLLAWPAVRAGEGIARPLAAGVGLTLVTMLVLLPWQGHGWGYRYLHGLLGSLCLLAGYGAARLADRSSVGSSMALATAATLLLALPIHLAQARSFVAPYRAAHAALLRSAADVVLVDPAGLFFAGDLVRNDADLSGRPKLLDLRLLDRGQVARLCAAYRVERFGVEQGRRAGIRTIPAEAHPRGRDPAPLLDRLGCGGAVTIP